MYQVGSNITEEALKALVRGDPIVGEPCRRRKEGMVKRKSETKGWLAHQIAFTFWKDGSWLWIGHSKVTASEQHGLFLSRSDLLFDAGWYVRSVDVTGAVWACGSVNRRYYLQNTVLCESVMAGGVSRWRLRTVHSASDEEQKGYFCHRSPIRFLSQQRYEIRSIFLQLSPIHLKWMPPILFLPLTCFFAFNTN